MFNAFVTFTDERSVTYNGLHEIDYNYATAGDHKRVAFESNYFGTGITHRADEIRRIEVFIAPDVRTEFATYDDSFFDRIGVFC